MHLAAGQDAPISLHDWEELARRRIEPAAFDYVAGGAGDELTIADNRAAFARWRIMPRALVPDAGARLATTVLGQAVAAPIMVAPFAYQGVLHPDAEVATATGAAAAGVGLCLSTLANRSLEDVAAAGGPRWFQLYPMADRGVSDAMIARARAAGYSAIVITVDLPPFGSRDRDARSGFAIPADLELPNIPPPPDHDGSLTPRQTTAMMSLDLSWGEIAHFAATAGLPVVVKGILSAADAVLAVEHGAAGVVVSNHGGRQLDTVIASIDALPAVAAAVGDRSEVYLDGGVRRGSDVVTALALGARAVLIGRPVAYGLAAAGAEGVRTVLATLAAETQAALALSGCTGPDEVPRDRVVAPGQIPG